LKSIFFSLASFYFGVGGWEIHITRTTQERKKRKFSDEQQQPIMKNKIKWFVI